MDFRDEELEDWIEVFSKEYVGSGMSTMGRTFDKLYIQLQPVKKSFESVNINPIVFLCGEIRTTFPKHVDIFFRECHM